VTRDFVTRRLPSRIPHSKVAGQEKGHAESGGAVFQSQREHAMFGARSSAQETRLSIRVVPRYVPVSIRGSDFGDKKTLK